MNDIPKSNFPNAWTTGHPGVVVSLDQSRMFAAHRSIFGATRTGMSAGPVLPQLAGLVKKLKR